MESLGHSITEEQSTTVFTIILEVPFPRNFVPLENRYAFFDDMIYERFII